MPKATPMPDLDDATDTGTRPPSTLMHTTLPPNGVYLAGRTDVAVELSLTVARALVLRPSMKALDACLVVEDSPADTWMRVDLDSASIRTGFPPTDAIARSPQMLDTAEFGIVRFESTSFTEREPGRFIVEGDLYVRDVVATATLSARLVRDGYDDGVVRLALDGSVSRSALGLTVPDPWSRVAPLVSDRIRIRAALALTLSDPDPSEVFA